MLFMMAVICFNFSLEKYIDTKIDFLRLFNIIQKEEFENSI